MRRALGLSPGAAALGAASAGAAAARLAPLVKVGGALVAAAIFGGGASFWMSRRAAPIEPRPVAVATMRAGAELDGAEKRAEPAESTDPLPRPPVAEREPPAEARGAEPQEPLRRLVGSPAPRRGSDLAEQIRLLDTARAAVAGNEPAAALAALDSYGSRFPRGPFRQEAAVLRMEALAERGEVHRAAALARAFLAKNPTSPHVARVTRLIDRASR